MESKTESTTESEDTLTKLQKIVGTKLKICKTGADLTDWEDFKKAKIIGIYFSAHWCPPCTF